jgi:4-hydroxybenzoate polyprenyltransferase
MLGPLSMGLCRSLNILLGASLIGPLSPMVYHLASVTGLYIVGVTWLARTEEGISSRRALRFAAGVMALAFVAGLGLPLHHETGSTPWYFPYLLILFGFYLAEKVIAAVQYPGSQQVQAAVKRSILGLIPLQAILASIFVGWVGLLIVGLLIPARLLGRKVYST